MNIKEKYTEIDADIARKLLEAVKHMSFSHRGIDRRAYLFDEYAVLSASRLKLRNVDVRDDGLLYLDDIIRRLSKLADDGVNVVPILGYCFDSDSPDGEGFLIMQRANGAELYDDAVICRYEAWTQGQDEAYLKSGEDSAEYIVNRTHEIAEAPQEHFDKLVHDIMAVLKNDILIDFQGKSNFFYEEKHGFQLIDLDSHTDNYYGLTDEKVSIEAWAAVGSFVPCHFGNGTVAFAGIALDDRAVSTIGEKRIKQLASYNLAVFDKCVNALKANGVPERIIQNTFKRIRVFGQ